jgi:membrane dipeptidase
MSDAGVATGQRQKASALVQNLLDKFPLIDGHNDTPSVIRNDSVARGDVRAFKLDAPKEGDTDIPRLIEGKIGGQLWAAFVESSDPHPATTTLELIDIVHQLTEVHPSIFANVLRADDFAKARQAGKIGSMLAVEGGVGLENSLAPLRIWYAAGVRLMTLCHNGSLDWVDSATDEPRNGGLSDFGRLVIGELNRLGIMVDCAHVSPDAMRQVLDVSTAPIVISHSNALSLCSNVRNVPDDVLDRIPGNDGLVMVTFIPDFVSEEVREWMAPVRKLYSTVFTGPERRQIMARYEADHGPRPRATLSQVADHIEYIAERVGPDRIGIGSDFCNAPVVTRGLEDVSRIKDLLVEMAVRGWDEDRLAKLAGLNFIRVFRAVEAEAERLRGKVKPVFAIAKATS